MAGKYLRRFAVILAVLAFAAVAAPAALADKPADTPRGKSAEAKAAHASGEKYWDVKVSRGATTLASWIVRGLEVKAFKPAKLDNGTLTLPVTEGKLKVTRDAQTQAVTGVLGYIRHAGAFSLTMGDKSIKARNVLLRFTRDGVNVVGRVKGKLALLGTVIEAKFSTTADGKRFLLTDGKYVLSDRLANFFGQAAGTVAASDVDVSTRILPKGASSS